MCYQSGCGSHGSPDVLVAYQSGHCSLEYWGIITSQTTPGAYIYQPECWEVIHQLEYWGGFFFFFFTSLSTGMDFYQSEYWGMLYQSEYWGGFFTSLSTVV